MTMHIEILDTVTDPGHPGGENEDAIGWNAQSAFVVDGATSLGAPMMRPPGSDAAWLAQHAAAELRRTLVDGLGTADAVRALNRRAADAFLGGGDEIERYRYPTASFLSLRVAGDELELSGLGDCVAFLRDEAGEMIRWSALAIRRSREQYFAKIAMARAGGFDKGGATIREPATLDDLRSRRARHNLPGGTVWTLGLEPMAADHLAFLHLHGDKPRVALLCTDGFADLVDNYGRCDAADLISRAGSEGLVALRDELRWVERELDPDGTTYPRYKRCDDASAILLRVGA